MNLIKSIIAASAKRTLTEYERDLLSAALNVPAPKKRERKSIGGKPPSVTEVIDFVVSKGYSTAFGVKIYEYYHDEKNPDAPWKDGRGHVVVSWRQKIRGVWFRPDNDVYKINRTSPSEKAKVSFALNPKSNIQ